MDTFAVSCLAYNSITAAQNAKHFPENRDASNFYTTPSLQTSPLPFPADWADAFTEYTGEKGGERGAKHLSTVGVYSFCIVLVVILLSF